MNRFNTMTAITLAACIATTAQSAEVTVSADLVSAYVFRGVTLNDGWVLQPGLEFGGLPVPLTLGIWANLDLEDYDTTLENGQFSEIDLYASYEMPQLREALSWSIGYTEYTYPMAGDPADREVQLGFALDIPLGNERFLAPTLDLFYGLDGGIDNDFYAELALGQAWQAGQSGAEITLDTALGYARPDEGANGFSHYTLSGGIQYKILTATLTYVGRIDQDVLPDAVPARNNGIFSDAESGYDSEWILSFGAAFTF